MEEKSIPLKKKERCKDCPYPATGFICRKKGGECLKQMMRKIYGIKTERSLNNEHQQS